MAAGCLLDIDIELMLNICMLYVRGHAGARPHLVKCNASAKIRCKCPPGGVGLKPNTRC